MLDQEPGYSRLSNIALVSNETENFRTNFNAIVTELETYVITKFKEQHYETSLLNNYISEAKLSSDTQAKQRLQEFYHQKKEVQ